MQKLSKEVLKPIVEAKARYMRCNCDLDNWQPEPVTGHSWVCRIHKAAMKAWRDLTENQ